MWIVRNLLAVAVLGTKTRIDTWKMLAHLLDAGFSLERALGIAIETADAQGQQLRAWVFKCWRRALLANRFASEIARWIPASEAMIFTGYGRVDAALLFAAAARVADVRARQLGVVVRALALPVVLTVMIVLILWGAGLEFIPVMEKISPRSGWDLTTRLLGDASTWVYEDIATLAVGVAAGLAALAAVMVLWTGPGRAALDRVPPFSIYRTLTGSSFIFVVTEFLRAGLDLNDRAFEVLKESAGAYARSRIGAIQRQMAAGHGLGAAMSETGHGFPDPSLVPVIAALDGTPRWEAKLADFVAAWVERSEASLRAGAMVINGLLMILVTAITAVAIDGMYGMMSAAQTM